jgi:transcriptional regulator with XRE-family HTH domain
MGYAERLRKLCATRGLDQSALAERVGISKSSMSRILSGAQEPKLLLAYELAKALGVTMDYLVDESLDDDPSCHLVVLTEDESTILKIVRRLGTSVAIDRLIGVAASDAGGTDVEQDTKKHARPHADHRKGGSHGGSPPHV